MNPKTLWQPRAEHATLQSRARLLASLRAFFSSRDVLEVETPILSRAGTVDPAIDSFATTDGRWLQTSPEFPMKRLVAAGSGPIYQVARVFRIDEAGRHHNPEFTMLEWYRPGFDHHALMDEVEGLLRALGIGGEEPLARLTYREAFIRHAAIDPFIASLESLRLACEALPGGAPETPVGDASEQRDWYCDLLMSHRVGPSLGKEQPVFLLDFPASQAALARIRRDDPPVAERFEVFWRGIELANGFHELADAGEQRARFERDHARRVAAGRPTPPIDEHLLAALAQGFPDCAGVALGLDRLLMLLLGHAHIGQVLAMDDDRA
jgi:lysyl-tRNA synthetase class 2